jgi:5-methylcytosine-specific restriction endonuclease McrA
MNTALAEAQRLRGTRTWKAIRAQLRRDRPLCCNPLKRHDGPQPTEHIHHIVPITEDPSRVFDLRNLAPLCVDCHGAIEAMERSGTSTRHLFDHGTPRTTPEA